MTTEPAWLAHARATRTRALQTLLAKEGLYSGAIDGADGPKTNAALIALQIKRGGCARRINRIVLHCTATREGQFVDAAEIRRWHQAKGWKDIGYHHVHLLDGTVQPGRPEVQIGAHAEGFNADSIGVVYVGGVAANGQTPKDTRTAAQKMSLGQQLLALSYRYPGADICGHRDLSPDRNGDGRITPDEWMKACPSFDAAGFVREIGLQVLA
ncbi:N-acetylmuramoyl-L-alanine amidase [Sphingomonas sp.]|uniref:peptidoglycan recognition protein family protein n=1 Tax=Sphingomonas sp. TaxID=28214 RepID=UPI000DB835B8|nr:N-acetylmuramoyl-L-alanine amidase [Sphingomonas sp.]PZU10042.1 MAG: N-acetylmuramoyl-L-alanine amidase [Sphingomonas sp.]